MTEDEKDNQLGINSAADIIDEKLSPEAKNILAKIDNQEKHIKYNSKASNVSKFNFSEYNSLK